MFANVARKKGFLVENFPNVTLTSQSAKISRVAKQRKIMLKNNCFPFRLHRRQSLLWVAEKKTERSDDIGFFKEKKGAIFFVLQPDYKTVVFHFSLA